MVIGQCCSRKVGNIRKDVQQRTDPETEGTGDLQCPDRVLDVVHHEVDIGPAVEGENDLEHRSSILRALLLSQRLMAKNWMISRRCCCASCPRMRFGSFGADLRSSYVQKEQPILYSDHGQLRWRTNSKPTSDYREKQNDDFEHR